MLGVVPLVVEPQDLGPLGVVDVLGIVVVLVQEALLDPVLELGLGLDHLVHLDGAWMYLGVLQRKRLPAE